MGETPFEFINRLIAGDNLLEHLQSCKTGSYTKLNQTFRGIVSLNVLTCSVSELEAIHGIGPKTSRFFVVWTRKDQPYAALDVHVLRWLKYLGHDVPKSTPSGDKYLAIQKIFLDEAEARGRDPRELDSEIWLYSSNGGHKLGTWPTTLQKRE